MEGRNGWWALLGVIPLLLVPLLVLGCSATPRVTTQAERDTALATLQQIDLGIDAAQALKPSKVTQEFAGLAHQQVATLRARIVASETVPISAMEVLGQVESMALAWVIQKQQPQPPPAK